MPAASVHTEEREPDDTPTPARRYSPLVYADVPYVPDGDPRQILDVYLPGGLDGPAPVLILIHGGGFLEGSKSSLARTARHFAEMGYAALSIEYRLAPAHTYPAQVRDVFCARAWILANADDYDFDAERIVVVGESVGGTLAVMLGVVDDAERYMKDCPYPTTSDTRRVQGVVAYYPVINFDLDTYGSFFHQYLGTEAVRDPELWAEASPLNWIDGSEPPFLIIHGLWDVRVPLSESLDLMHALESAGVKVSLVRIPRADHSFLVVNPGSTEYRLSLEAVEAFLNELTR